MIFGARDLRGLENKVQLESVLSAIRSRMKDHQNPPIYLSLDIDCLDPAFAPGTGTPVGVKESMSSSKLMKKILGARWTFNFAGCKSLLFSVLVVDMISLK
jgi:arginase family enzyme